MPTYYFALGQRIAPIDDDGNLQQLNNFTEAETWLQSIKDDSAAVAAYYPQAGWIALADMTLFKTLRIGAIYYDPLLYALLVTVMKDEEELVTFEVAYHKVTEQIGMWYASVSAPEAIRTIELGEVSLTLPDIAVSVYTNGDFKVDVGYPPDPGDWSRCIRVQVLPFTGSGGFYFGRLSSDVAQPFTGSDTYKVIVVAGVALSIGLGKDIEKGPFSAGLSISFFGIVEGAGGYKDAPINFFHPDHIRVKGQLGIIGQIYGSVDFAIIRAAVNVMLMGAIGVILETGQPTIFSVDAELDVGVEVEIDLWLFTITISLSFNWDFHEEWTLGQSDEQLLLAANFGPIPWMPTLRVPNRPDAQEPLALYFTPEVTLVYDSQDWNAKGVPNCVGSLALIFDSADPNNAFNRLARHVARWVMQSALGTNDDALSVTHEQLRIVQRRLHLKKNLARRHRNLPGDNAATTLDYQQLVAHLQQDFQISISAPSTTKPPETQRMITFPMIPDLILTTAGRQKPDGSADEYRVDFAQHSLRGLAYEQFLEQYFAQLYILFNKQPSLEAVADDTCKSVATMLFEDYFNCLIKSVTDHTWKHMRRNGLAAISLADVADIDYQQVAGQMSMLFRHGLKLPCNIANPQPCPGDDGHDPCAGQDPNSLIPLYALTGQQFPAGAPATGASYAMQLQPGPKGTWFNVVDQATASLDLIKLSAFCLLRVDPPFAAGGLTTLPYLRTAKRTFNFSNQSAWTVPAKLSSTPWMIQPFPTDLNALLSQLASPTEVATIPATVMQSENTRPDAPADTPVTAPLNWGGRLDLNVQRVPATDGSAAFIPNLYQIGGTDAANFGLITQLLMAANTSALKPTLNVLYQPAAGAAGLMSDANDTEIFLLRTNMTTESAPPPNRLRAAADELTSAPELPVAARLTDVADFLTIVQQCSIVNTSGYYLFYRKADGTGLPDALFGKESVAPLTLLATLPTIAPGQSTAIPACANVVVLQQDPAAAKPLYYAAATNLYAYQVAVEAGCVGIGGSRTAPKGSSQQVTIDKMYNLLSYRIDGSADFRLSPWSSPGGPETVGDQWQYQLYAPLYRFVVNGSAEPSPYDVIGKSVTIAAEVRDFFGNTLTPSETQLTVKDLKYFDSLIPLAQWPAVATAYTFAGPATLAVTASVNVTKLPQGGQPLQDAIALYQRIVNQLNAPHTGAYLSTSLDQITPAQQVLGAPGACAAYAAGSPTLVQFAAAILAYLQNQTGQPPVPVSMAYRVAQGRRTEAAYAISVELGLLRDRAYVEPEALANNLDALSVGTTVTADTSSETALALLAKAFEQTSFPGLRLATGVGESGRHTLYAVNGGLLQMQISQATPWYFSPKPLSNQLKSQTIPVPQYDPQFMPLADTQHNFSNIDLDVIGHQFFASVDSALGPSIAAGIYRNNRPGYDSLARSRADLAEGYSYNQVAWLFQEQDKGPDTSRTAARKAFAEQMRAANANAYNIDTVLQYPITWSGGVPADALDRIRLFGRVAPVDAQQSGGAAWNATSKVSITVGAAGQPAGLLTFLYSPTRQDPDAHVSLNLAYTVTHVEQVLGDVPAADDAQSRWLRLVNPAQQTPPAATAIPVPLRQFPVPPALIRQHWSQEAPAAAGKVPIAQLRRWAYQFQYQPSPIQQDLIVASVAYNRQTTPQFTMNASRWTLFEALARFQVGYAQLQATINALGSGGVDPTKAKNAIDRLAELVDGVVNNATWADWRGGPGAAGLQSDGYAAGPVAHTDTYNVQMIDSRTLQICPANSSLQNVTLMPCQPAGSPMQQVTTKPVGDCVQVTYADKLQPGWLVHEVGIAHLDVISTENAQASVQVKRNAKLLSEFTTESAFIYTTAEVSFAQGLTPFIDSNEPYPIPEQGTLAALLSGFLQELFQPDATVYDRMNLGLDQGVRRVKVECSYRLPLFPGGDEAISAQQPLQLAKTFLLRIAGVAHGNDDPSVSIPDFASQFAAQVQPLLADKALTGLIVFDVTVYASLGAPNLPVLRLRNVQLPLGNLQSRD